MQINANKCKCQNTGQRQRPGKRNFGGRSLYVLNISSVNKRGKELTVRHNKRNDSGTEGCTGTELEWNDVVEWNGVVERNGVECWSGTM